MVAATASAEGAPTYRRDIDGLRALAVLPVVLFHAGAPGFSGGYVGVDIFFVISGFLITGILVSERHSFSLVGFYNRRIRRIFPALFTLLAVVTAAASLVLTPEDLRRYAVSLGATAAFCSNIYFYLGSGYFETAAASKPLLHTWSLAVEEQYYIAWPLLLWVLRGAPRRVIVLVTLALLAVSFGLSVWLTPHNADAAFYLPFTRIWELLLGSALALRPVHLGARWLRSAVAAVGVALILFAIVGFTGETAFPGYAAAAPCLGAAMIIAANQRGDTFVARMLSLQPAVFVGLISYSLYLWHWPLLSLAHYVLYRPLTGIEAGALVAAAFLMATLSWRFVERPFRRGASRPQAWRRSLPAGAAVMALALVVAAPIYLFKGFPDRVSPEVRLAEQASLDEPKVWDCTPDGLEAGCRFGAAGERPSILLWGDSHAGAFSPGLAVSAAKAGLAGLRLSLSGCAPLLGVTRLASRHDCRPFNDQVLAHLAGHPEITTVILAARWDFAAEGDRFGEEEGEHALLIDAAHPVANPENNHLVFSEAFDRTVASIRRVRPTARIIVVGQAPSLLYDAPKCLARARQYGRSEEDCRYLPIDLARQRITYAKQVLRDVAGRYGAELYMLDEKICDELRCAAVRGDSILYLDSQHLSATGARLLARDFPISAPSR